MLSRDFNFILKKTCLKKPVFSVIYHRVKSLIYKQAFVSLMTIPTVTHLVTTPLPHAGVVFDILLPKPCLEGEVQLLHM